MTTDEIRTKEREVVDAAMDFVHAPQYSRERSFEQLKEAVLAYEYACATGRRH